MLQHLDTRAGGSISDPGEGLRVPQSFLASRSASAGSTGLGVRIGDAPDGRSDTQGDCETEGLA